MDVFSTGKECCDSHKIILIVGEGNFSFASEFVKHVTGDGWFVYATSLDSQETVFKDEFAKHNVECLRSYSHVTVCHGVDATRIHDSYPEHIFSLIIFNFPHVGGKSNIKKCRVLLSNFLCSGSQHLCEHGRILVSLCRGQGGTPADVSRATYGNSWQVASQAAKAGLYLKRIEPFRFNMLETYKQAGYRGSIGRGFLTKGGLVHIFRKGELFRIQPCPGVTDRLLGLLNSPDSQHSPYDDDSKYAGFIRQQRRHSAKVTDVLEDILDHNMTKFGRKFNLSFCSSLSETYTPSIYIELPGFSKFQHQPHCRLLLNVVDITASLTPVSQAIMRHVAYTIQTSHICDDYERFSNEVQTFLCDHLFVQFECTVVRCHCEREDIHCSCICGDNRLCQKLQLKGWAGLETSGGYDVDKVPYFINDIPPAFWACFEPECTISLQEQEGGEIQYQNVHSSKYVLDDREEKYFPEGKEKTKFGERNRLVDKTRTKFIVNGICVATLFATAQESQDGRCQRSKAVVVFHVSHILFSCYNVTDLRFLHTDDVIFSKSLRDCLQNDQANDYVIGNHSNREYETTIKYPLCHRHDLCFWLDEKHTEKDLYRAVRLIGGDYVHSVRLIKVLKHTETNLMSYCYRMIYCRLDGPFHHKQCVQIQNELRMYLLKRGFLLR